MWLFAAPAPYDSYWSQNNIENYLLKTNLPAMSEFTACFYYGPNHLVPPRINGLYTDVQAIISIASTGKSLFCYICTASWEKNDWRLKCGSRNCPVSLKRTRLTKNPKCRNSNHNCCNFDQPRLSQLKPQLSQVVLKKIWLPNCYQCTIYHPISMILASLLMMGSTRTLLCARFWQFWKKTVILKIWYWEIWHCSREIFGGLIQIDQENS